MGRKINDKILLKALLRNAKLPNAAIASLFEVSETAVRKRIEKLEEAKIILGYRAFIDPSKAGLYVSLTGIDVDPEHLMPLYRKLRDIREIEAIYMTSGDHNLIVELVCYDMETLRRIHEDLGRMDGVKRVCPAVVTDVWKRGMK